MAGFFETMRRGIQRTFSEKKKEPVVTKKAAPAGQDRQIEKEDKSKRRKQIDRQIEEAGG